MNRDLNPTYVDKQLIIKIPVVISEVNAHLPQDYVLDIFETYRTVADQQADINRGVSQIKNAKNGPHVYIYPSKLCKHNGIWTWTAPICILNGEKINGWDLLDKVAIAHNLQRLRIKFGYSIEDCPHVQLPAKGDTRL